MIQVGRHLAPDDGACLMELVGLAAGEPWGDQPACTHPLLAHVARRVNDSTSDTRRAELAPFIPRLATADTDDGHASARIAAACTRVALEQRPTVVLRLLHTAALSRSNPLDRRSHWLYDHSTAYRSVDLAAFSVLGSPRADDLLLAMLTSSMEALVGRWGASPLGAGGPGAQRRRSSSLG